MEYNAQLTSPSKNQDAAQPWTLPTRRLSSDAGHESHSGEGYCAAGRHRPEGNIAHEQGRKQCRNGRAGPDDDPGGRGADVSEAEEGQEMVAQHPDPQQRQELEIASRECGATAFGPPPERDQNCQRTDGTQNRRLHRGERPQGPASAPRWNRPRPALTW